MKTTHKIKSFKKRTVEDSENETFIFQFETSLKGTYIDWFLKWSLHIEKEKVEPFLEYDYYEYSYIKLLNNTKKLYSFYKAIYKDSSYRVKALAEMGPMMSFEEFKLKCKKKER